VAQWVFHWPWNTVVPCSYHTAASGNSERIIACMSRAFWKLNQFSKRVIFDKNHTYALFLVSHQVQTRDLPLLRQRHYHLSYRCSVFTDWKLARSCENLWLIYNPWSIFEQNFCMCKIQSSRLDRIFWSHRWWKVVPLQKFVNIIIRNWTNSSVSGTAGAV